MTRLIKDTIEKPIDQEDSELQLFSFNTRKKFNRENISDKFQTIRRVELPTKKSKAAAISPIYAQQQKSILTRNQLLQCADAYTNDGTLRTAINKHIDFILGERTKFTVELNEELTEFATEEEIDALQSELKSAEVDELRTKIIRINKRVQLHARMIQLLISAFVFGRSISQIVRFPRDQDYAVFGEPRAILNLNTTRIVDVNVDSATGDFKGYYYDYGIVEKNKVLIPSTELLPFWIDDANLYDNTLYAGTSPIWPLLNLVYTNQIINDEDLPEATKTTWSKFALIYSGTSKQSVTARINDQLKAGTALVHNQEKMKSEVYDLGKDIRELTDVRSKNSQYMVQCTGLPIFFMFEDVPNFATAGATLSSYKASTLLRYRTMIRGILEKYWYDPIMADHFNVPLDDVISLRIKVRAAFEDVIFDTFKERVDALAILFDKGLYDEEKVLKELDAEDVLERKRQLEAVEKEQMQEEIDKLKEQQATNQFGNGQQQQQGQGQGQQVPPTADNEEQQQAQPPTQQKKTFPFQQ